jgi:hypothetical protein
MQPLCIEIGHLSINKVHQNVCGDSFVSHRVPSENRTVAVLADGLGSGVKASVLSLLTSTMAARCVSGDMDARQTARIIMETLPICKVRKIGYATFTILDIDNNGRLSVIEYDNPGFIWMRGDTVLPAQTRTEVVTTADKRTMELRLSQLTLEPGDRLIVFSDGVNQSGMGRPDYPLGWTQEGVTAFLCNLLKEQPHISAQDISAAIASHAHMIDMWQAKDDITVAAIYFRHPREALILTGPPYERSRDREIADMCANFAGTVAICGGTTASIVARELGRTLEIDINGDFSELPPTSRMEGIDLITEGTVTIARALVYLENDTPWMHKNNPATQLLRLLLNSDTISFVVGTRVNEAHHDPTLPVELDIRRNIIRRLATILEEKYLKTVSIRLM